jgi:hypothetical protein
LPHIAEHFGEQRVLSCLSFPTVNKGFAVLGEQILNRSYREHLLNGC